MQNGSGNLRVCLGEGAPAQTLQLGGDGAQARLERRAVGLVGDLLKLFADSTHSIGLLEALLLGACKVGQRVEHRFGRGAVVLDTRQQGGNRRVGAGVHAVGRPFFLRIEAEQAQLAFGHIVEGHLVAQEKGVLRIKHDGLAIPAVAVVVGAGEVPLFRINFDRGLLVGAEEAGAVALELRVLRIIVAWHHRGEVVYVHRVRFHEVRVFVRVLGLVGGLHGDAGAGQDVGDDPHLLPRLGLAQGTRAGQGQIRLHLGQLADEGMAQHTGRIRGDGGGQRRADDPLGFQGLHDEVALHGAIPTLLPFHDGVGSRALQGRFHLGGA